MRVIVFMCLHHRFFHRNGNRHGSANHGVVAHMDSVQKNPKTIKAYKAKSVFSSLFQKAIQIVPNTFWS